MRKIYNFTIVLLVLLMCNCSGNNDKTEVRIQLSETEYLYTLSNYTNDSTFITAYKIAKLNYNPEKEEFIDVLAKKLLELNPEISLASFFSTYELKDRVSYSTTNEEVIIALKEECKLAKEKTIQVLKARIASSYSEESFMSKILNKLEILIEEMPGANTYQISINRKFDANRLTQLLEQKSDIGFWETYDNSEIFEYLRNANTLLKEIKVLENRKENKENTKKNDLAEENPLMDIKSDDLKDYEKDNPLFFVLKPSVSNEGQLTSGPQIGIALIKDTALVNKYLSIHEIRNLFPNNLKMMWTLKPISVNEEFISLIAIKISNRDGKAPLSGDVIVKASANESDYRETISLKMNAEGAQIWSRMTRDNIGRQIAIVFNNKVYSYPTVQSEINEGRSEISGNFSTEEANDMASILSAGPMPNITVKVVKMNN